MQRIIIALAFVLTATTSVAEQVETFETSAHPIETMRDYKRALFPFTETGTCVEGIVLTHNYGDSADLEVMCSNFIDVRSWAVKIEIDQNGVVTVKSKKKKWLQRTLEAIGQTSP